MMMNKQLKQWIPNNIIVSAIPLNDKVINDKYIIHHYEGFDTTRAETICDEMLEDINLINPVNIYLYLFEYPHHYENLDRLGSNNGYMQKNGEYYSIVIFRHLFWPKVLVHELLHIFWFTKNIPIERCSPRWDEAIIEAYAVEICMRKGYINTAEYRYYLKQSQDIVSNKLQCPPENLPGKLSGGKLDQLCLANQSTNVLEYLFISERIRNMMFQNLW